MLINEVNNKLEVLLDVGKAVVTTDILFTSNRHCDFDSIKKVQLSSSISYSRERTYVKALGKVCEEEAEDNILVDNFYDGLYSLFKKDKKTWDEEDKFLMKSVSDYLSLVVKRKVKRIELEVESFDLFHYAFIVPSEWEEEMRENIIRPIFVQSGLILNEDHQDKLLFFSNIESICYGLKDKNADDYSFKRGQNTILCRLSPDKREIVLKFDLIQTTNTLFNFPNSKMFPKDQFISSGYRRGAVRKSPKSKLVLVDQDQIVENEEVLKDEENEETKRWRAGS
ncbi:hypothetical protein MFLAVUS_002642 [Mucor flavus]|uniref:Uncharacterized protein n=1 Tax=Mucor flavus TaxID=439312 RepID=A0ABP9YQX0_9FUNG